MRVMCFILCLLCCMIIKPALAANLMQYTENLPIQLDTKERAALLTAFQFCGSLANIDDQCVISQLESLQNEGQERAKIIVRQFKETQSLGKADKPECQLETHRKSNRVVGHCMLVMNYFAIENQDADQAVRDYEECLTSSMLALTYQGNIVAQYFLIQLYNQQNLGDTGRVWTRALKMRQETDEYKQLIECYGDVTF